MPAGPRQDDSYNDNREDYSHNEPAVDYNAGFSGADACSFNKGRLAIQVALPST